MADVAHLLVFRQCLELGVGKQAKLLVVERFHISEQAKRAPGDEGISKRVIGLPGTPLLPRAPSLARGFFFSTTIIHIPDEQLRDFLGLLPIADCQTTKASLHC